jgi:hypothetical protein
MMFAEIAANPAALPLWGVFVFAALMYPLGLLLPGCPCCGSGCTQCGTFATGYAEGQDAAGRMCCTGTLSSSVTVRYTNVGPSTSSHVERSSTTSPYIKTTSTFSCDSMNADYVLNLSRINLGPSASCEWAIEAGETCNTGDYRLISLRPRLSDRYPPYTTESFPGYRLELLSRTTLSGQFRTQTCSGHPGVETCNVGSTGSVQMFFVDPDPIPSVVVTEQKCNPSGLVVASSVYLWTNQSCTTGSVLSASRNTGCLAKIEIV